MAAVAFGVHLISRGDGDPTTTPFPSHRVMAEDGVRIEQLGLESVWLPDHLATEQELLAGLSSADREELTGLLRRLLVALGRVPQRP